MTHPIFICNGIFRSGSTWSFNVCRQLVTQLAVRRGQRFGSAFLDHNALDEYLRNGVSSAPGPVLIKAHFIGPLALQWLRLSKMKAVCTYRDPRDCVASDRTFLGWDMDRIVNRVLGNYQAVDEYRGCSSILMVRFEEMMRDPMVQIRRIAGHFDIDLPEQTLRQIDAETNIQSSLKICQQLKYRAPNEVTHVADHRVDPLTQLHNNHIHSAKIGRWRDELTADEGRELTRIFHPWLVKFGYDIETPRATYAREPHLEIDSKAAPVLNGLSADSARMTAVIA
jgi:hypothetical protein